MPPLPAKKSVTVPNGRCVKEQQQNVRKAMVDISVQESQEMVSGNEITIDKDSQFS